MPLPVWSDKRERQYEHIKEGLIDRGDSEDLAEEIAARTVNKERVKEHESKKAQLCLDDQRHLLRAPGGPALTHRSRRADPGSALRRARLPPGRQGPLHDVKGSAPAGG